MNPLQTIIVLLAWLAAIFAADIIGGRKGRRGTGLLLGLILGWIGVAVIALCPPTRDALVQRERERLQIRREAAGP